MTRVVVDPEAQYGHLRNKVNWAVCDKCGWEWPENLLNERDGRKVCPNHSTYKETERMRDARFKKAADRVVRQKEPQPKWPYSPEFRSAAAPEKLSPSKVSLLRGGAGVALTVTGRNLSAADTITSTSVDVTFAGATPTAIDAETFGNTLTVTLQAANPAAVRGDFDLIYNGNTFPKAIEVR